MENYNENNSKNINESTVSHIKINTDEVYEFIENKAILEILELVKQSYPFTFIGRQKFRRKIDQLNFNFWIKDTSDKIVIVNENFAKSFNQKISEVEGKSISEIYNQSEYLLVKNITNYITDTSNSAIYETYSQNSDKSFMQTVEFPICDIENKVVAIIGFKQEPFELANLIMDKNESQSTLDDIPAVVVEVSNDFSVNSFSNKFYREFNLNPNSILGQNLKSIFNLDFSKIVLSNSGSKIKIGKNEYCFEFKNISNKNDGYYFSFNRIIEKASDSLSGDKTFDMVMYTSPDPMFIYSINNLKFLKVNEAALKFYGYREEEFLGMDLTDLYAPEDIQTLVDSASRNSTERGYTGPWRQKKKDGSMVEVEISKSGIEYKNSRAHFNIVHDISKVAETNEIEYELIYENSSDIILSTDADGFIKSGNKSAAEKLGYTIEALKDRSFLSLVTDGYRAKVNTSIFHSAVPSKVELNCELKAKDGKPISSELISVPIMGSNNQVQTFSIFAKVEKETVVKTVVKKEIVPSGHPKQKGSLDNDFLGHLFHELLTPVNVIIGFSQELAESAEDSNTEAKESAEIIKQNQRLLLQLMDNAVQYTELEQNKVKPNPTNVHFVELIDQIENDIKKVSVDLSKKFAYGKISSSLIFETDESKLQTLAGLLIEFAMRATKKEKIFLSAYQNDAGHCVVAVKDDRNAISKELAKSLEEIFHGDENTVRHTYGISRFTRRFALKLTEVLADSYGIIKKYGDDYEFGFTFPIRFDAKKFMSNTPNIEDENIIDKADVPEVPSQVKDKAETREPITLNVSVNTQSNAQQNISQTPEATEVEPQVVDELDVAPEQIPVSKDTSEDNVEVETI